MGAIYAAADDEEELLIPFVLGNSGLKDVTSIARHCVPVRLGELNAKLIRENGEMSDRISQEMNAVVWGNLVERRVFSIVAA